MAIRSAQWLGKGAAKPITTAAAIAAEPAIVSDAAQAFKDVTCATDEQIDLGLTPGYGPIVKLEDIANPLSPANFLARQMLLTIDPDKVGSADFMSEFEGGFYQVLGHEFAHYLDAVVTGNAAGNAREEGNEWEEKVYGKR